MSGSLNYAANMTRSDICYATYSVMKHIAKPMESHHQAIKRIFRYLQGNTQRILTLGKGDATLTVMLILLNVVVELALSSTLATPLFPGTPVFKSLSVSPLLNPSIWLSVMPLVNQFGFAAY
jgi:hypothetical protein